MRVLFIIQDEPFILPKLLPEFFDGLESEICIAGVVLLSHSPTPKSEKSFLKAVRVSRIFGIRFFIHYLLRYVAGRLFGKSVEKCLLERGIKCLRLEKSINDISSLQEIRALRPDVMVSVLGSEIYKQDLLSIAPCLNLHTAMLPKYRGLMPTFWVLRNNEKYTGVSVFLVDDGIDSGPIVMQQKVTLEDNPTHFELIEVTKRIGLRLMSQALLEFRDGKMVTIANDENQSTYFGYPTHDDVKAFLRNGKRFF